MANVNNSQLFQDIQGIQQVKDALVYLIKTEWNAAIVNELENGCKTVFQQYNIKYQSITVPGAVEIPFAIQQCWANTNEPSAFIALGCVIRGDTPHFEYVCQSVTMGITQLNVQLPIPIVFGVLTVNDEQQAMDRIGGQHGHKGEEAAITALKMMVLNQKLQHREL